MCCAKSSQERDRRLRPEANDQYVEITADFRHYIDDPHVDPDPQAPNRRGKEKYSFGNEIRAHARRIGEHFDLYRLACFQTEISEMRWLQDENRWLITTNRGDAMHAR
jgi:cation diffusion facilitator CzcD-associated flavoprotein CzcO